MELGLSSPRKTHNQDDNDNNNSSNMTAVLRHHMFLEWQEADRGGRDDVLQAPST